MSKIKHSSDQQAFLDELAELWPLAKGSLAEVRKPCIRPNCAAMGLREWPAERPTT